MIFNDHKRYRARCEPRPLEEARKAMADFFGDLKELVEKYRVQDLTVCAMTNTIAPPRDLLDGDEIEAPIQLVAHIGDHNKALEMSAYAHAYLRVEHDNVMQHYKAQAANAARKDNR